MTRSRQEILLCLMAALLGGALTGTASPQADSPPATPAARMLQEAVRQETEGDLTAATRDYTLIVEHFPDTPAAGQALLRLAQLYRSRGDNSRAETAAQRVSRDHQGSPWGAGGLFVLGEIQADQAATASEWDEARATFRNVWMFYPRATLPDLQWRPAARVRYGEISLLTGADIAAATAFIEALENDRPSAWTARAALGLATVLADRGDWQGAAETLQDALDRLPAGSFPSLLRRLTLIHRMEIRPRSGQARWQAGRKIPSTQLRLDRPSTIAAAEDGRLAVADVQSPAITILEGDASTRQPQAGTPGGRLSWDNRGALHLPLQGGSLATLGSGHKLTLQEPGKPGQALKEVRAVERNAAGWWVLSARRVLRFAADGTFESSLFQPPDHRPIDLAQDLRGRIYVLDQKSRSVYRVEADGSERQTVANGDWGRPEALTVDALGNLYVLDQKNRRIEVFEPHGTRLDTLGPRLPGGAEIEAPRDIAVDGGGRIFIADVKLAQIIVLD